METWNHLPGSRLVSAWAISDVLERPEAMIVKQSLEGPLAAVQHSGKGSAILLLLPKSLKSAGTNLLLSTLHPERWRTHMLA